jgi:hypothetical protein
MLLTAQGRNCGVPVTSDLIPTTAVGKNGRGKACTITELLVATSRVLGVSKTAVLAEEFATFVDLEMALHIGAEELLPHFHRILISLDATPVLYMGQDSASMLEV